MLSESEPALNVASTEAAAVSGHSVVVCAGVGVSG